MPRTTIRTPNLAPNPVYSQATRAGDFVYISGQVSADAAGELVGEGDPQAQVQQVFSNLTHCLDQAAATFADVIDLVVYITDESVIEPGMEAFVTRFAEPRPSATLIKVSGLFDPRYLIEVKATAYTGE